MGIKQCHVLICFIEIGYIMTDAAWTSIGMGFTFLTAIITLIVSIINSRSLIRKVDKVSKTTDDMNALVASALEKGRREGIKEEKERDN